MDAIQKSYDELLAKLSRMRPTRARTYWKDDDFEALREHLTALAAAVDEHILDCGREAASQANGIDVADFTGVLSGALDGNALFVLQEAEEALRERTRSDRAEHSTLHRAFQGV